VTTKKWLISVVSVLFVGFGILATILAVLAACDVFHPTTRSVAVAAYVVQGWMLIHLGTRLFDKVDKARR
jgi:predicted membrane channel-forming protein YqfA (hemolysin III family)